MKFSEKLSHRIAATKSRVGLCVGLDPRPEQISGDVEVFLERLIDETSPSAAAFKPNIAYFEAMGLSGLAMLERLLKQIDPLIPIILDAKRGDIGVTSQAYARAAFEWLQADAVTVNPWLGFDSVEPFLQFPGKAIYLLGVTSNPGAADLQLQSLSDGSAVFEKVAAMHGQAESAKCPGELGFVIGLTNSSESVLKKFPDAPLLVPGFGAQGGDLAALDLTNRSQPILVNVSRGIQFGEGTVRSRAHEILSQLQQLGK